MKSSYAAITSPFDYRHISTLNAVPKCGPERDGKIVISILSNWYIHMKNFDTQQRLKCVSEIINRDFVGVTIG